MSDTETLTQKMHQLSEEKLPQKAQRTGDYPVRFDHCFKRIAFDAAACAKWDEVIERPFYSNATAEQKRRAVDVLEEMLRSPEKARQYNRQSLQYR